MLFNSTLLKLIFFIGTSLGGMLSIACAQEIPADMKTTAEQLAKNTEQLKASESFQALQRKIQLQQKELINRAITKVENQDFFSPQSIPYPQTSTNTWLFIFISSSMPESSIKNYIKAAQQTGARLVLNGLIDNDLPKTLKTISQWGEKDNFFEHILIDPIAYERFAIKQVPTIVLTQADYPCPGTTECIMVSIDRISGDISLDFALREFAQEGDLKNEAKHYLALIGETPHE